MSIAPRRRITPLLTYWIVALATCPPTTHARPPTEQVSGRNFVAWVSENAIQLDTLDWRAVDLSRLSDLDQALEGKRIVYLGEADHYVREKYDFQLILIRYLFEKGWRRIGAEMGRADGKRVDRFLETGDTAWLDRVASYGYRGDFRANRSDIPKGMVPAKPDHSFAQEVHSEQHWFQKQLRSLNESLPPGQPRLHWFGFDADLRAGGGYVDAEQLLELHRSAPLAQELLQLVSRVDGESHSDEIKRLADVLDLLDRKRAEAQACLGAADAEELRRTIRALKAGFEFIEAGKDGPSSTDWRPALRQREECMFRQMDEVLQDLPPDEKIILVGHMMHLSKDSDTLAYGAIGDPFSRPMWPSIGNHLARKLSGQVYSIWMLYDHGKHGVPMREERIQEIASNPDRIEYLLAKAGPRFLLLLHAGDPREAYLDHPHNFLNNGQYGNTILTNQADALFFVAEVHEPGGRQTAES